MVSAIDRAKRALVTLLKSLATAYGIVLNIKRDSPDTEIRSAYRKVSRKAHPDRSGNVEQQTALNNARDVWEQAVKERLSYATRGHDDIAYLSNVK